MARMRTIKPEACTSESLAEVPRAVRWTFACLWTHCDDNGRAVWNPRLVKAAICPLDDDVTIDVLRSEMAELERVGAVCIYEIDGKSYLHVPSWHEHQHPNRPQESKLPACPKTSHTSTIHVQRSDETVNEHGTLIPVVVEEGRVLGEGEAGREFAARSELAVAESPTAQTIVAEWIDRSSKRPPGQVIGQVAKLTGQMLAEGIDADDIRRGLAAWMTKGLHPSTLPSVVNEVMNTPRSNGAGKATTKAAGWLALDIGGTS